MKTFVIFLVFLLIAKFSEVNGNPRVRRVAAGVPSVKGENLDFCHLSITFYAKQLTCGCLIWDKRHVVTTARCVVDCTEKTATNITVTFPFKTGAERTSQVSKIFLPDGVFGNPVVPKYDETMEVPSTKFVGNNFAVLKLETPIKADTVTAIEGEPFIPFQETIAEFLSSVTSEYPNPIYRVCGIGATNNKGERPNDVLCTEVDIINPANGACKPMNGGPAYTLPDGVFCVQSPFGENNLCSGDYGGPIYVYSSINANSYVQGAIGLAIGSPDANKNTPCLDGHTVFAQFFTTPITNYIATIDPPGSVRKRILPENKRFRLK